MAWATTPDPRRDIPVEIRDVITDGSYVGPWIESTKITDIRVAVSFNAGTPTVAIEEAQSDGNVTVRAV